MKKTVLALSFLILILMFACAKKPVYPEAHADGENVRIILSELPDKKPVFFGFPSEKKRINYFVVKLDGSIQSYFDACAKCYKKTSGYSPEGRRIVCRTCNVNYSVDDLKDGIGSCYPIKLPGRIEAGEYVISKKDILSGRKFF